MRRSRSEYIAASEERWLDDLRAFVRFPSVSAQPAYRSDRQRCAEWLAERLRRAGLQNPALLEDGREATGPLVYADWLGAPGRPTVLIYGHYDVQPPEPFDEWETPPFELTVVGEELRGRGVADDKGQTLPYVAAIEAMLAADGRLPVNVKLLIEGDEEVSSPALTAYLATDEGRRRLACDVVVVSDQARSTRDRPTLIWSMRGACYLDLRVQTATSDLHSGTYGGAVANAAAILAEIVTSLHDADGRVAVAGFYDGVRTPSPDEGVRLAGLSFDEALWRADAGNAISAGELGYTALERAWLRPTLEVCGIWGGYDGPGLKAVVPAQAGAKIGGRLVEGQDPERIYQLVVAHAGARLPEGVQLETTLLSAARSVRVNPGSAWARAATTSIADVFGATPALGCEGGTIPVLTSFTERLTPELLLLGLAPPDYHGHAPNERMDLRTLRLAVPMIAAMLDSFGEIAP